MSATPRLADLAHGAVVYLDAARTRVAITGPDRVTWLNGVLTCDVAPLCRAGAHAVYGCALNVKGRVLADVVAIADGDHLGAWVPSSTAHRLVGEWDRFIVMEDCEIAVDEARRLIWVQGATTTKLLHDYGLGTRAAQLDDLGTGGGAVLDVARDEAEEIIHRLTQGGAIPLEPEAEHALRIEAGRATWGVDFGDHEYVQEAGLTSRAVSFSKGCYIGQEVVCMLEMRGKVHRRLVKIALPAEAVHTVAAGAEIKDGGTAVGKVTSVLPREGGAIALAMVKSVVPAGKSVDVAGVLGEVVAEVS